MGRKGDDTRTRLVDAARDLAETGGYHHAGLNQVIAASRAPRGSLYFHFPGGKDELIAEAVGRAGRELADTFAALPGTSTVDVMTGLLAWLGARLEDSGWQKGCPVATVALEVSATHDGLRAVCADAYHGWEAGLATRLRADGLSEDLATTLLALVEGALLLARTYRSREPLDRAATAVATLLAPGSPQRG